MIRYFFGFVVVLAFSYFFASASSADGVAVRVSQHSDFARLVFDWPKPVGMRSAQNDKILRITFEREIVARFEVITEELPNYVSGVRRPDDKSLELMLVKPINFVSRQDGNIIIVDLVDKQVTEAKVPPSAETAAGTVARVKLRAGVHDDKSRLVIDWPRRVAYDAITEFSSLTLSFGENVNFDLRDVRPSKLKFIDNVENVQGANGSAIRISKTANAPVKHFRVGNKIVVDIFKPPFGQKPSPKQSVEVKKPDPIPPENSSTTAVDETIGAQLSADTTTSIASSTSNETENTAPEKTTNDVISPVDEDQIDVEQAPISLKIEPSSEQAGPLMPKMSLPKIVEAAATGPRIPELASTTPHQDESKVLVLIEDGDVTSRIVFPFRQPVAAAAFDRLGILWVVFDVPRKAELLRAASDSLSVEAVSQIDHGEATILAIKLSPGLSPSMFRKQAIWVIELSRTEASVENPIPSIRSTGMAKGAQLIFPTIENGKPVAFFDNNILDRLIVVPVITSGAAVTIAGEYVDFETLRTIQGIAIRPKLDSVSVDVARDKISVLAPDSLALSPATMTIGRGDSRFGVVATKNPVMDLLGWRGGSDLGFVEAKSRLQTNIARTSDAARNRARFELAKLYLSYGLGAEALGQMTLIDENDAKFVRNHVYRAARGLARLLSHKDDLARDDLSHVDLAEYPDVALWRGVIHTNEGEFDKAVAIFPAGMNQFSELPSPLKQRVLEDWMLAATKTADEESFIVATELLSTGDLDLQAKSNLAWMRGLQAARQEKYEDALNLLDEAIDLNYHPVRARASMDRINLEHSLDKIDNTTAVNNLENLHYAWRGDGFELDLIYRLAELKIAQGEYREGLSLLRTGVTKFPNSREVKSMAELMDKVFEDIFLSEKVEILEPVSALGLYFDFQELTPVGPNGDEMIRRLSDRLAEVDLLGKAAELLEHQIEFRLKGAEKSRVGARLAVIKLLDANADGAIKALDESAFKIIPAGLRSERLYLRAKAYALKGGTKEALELIEADDSGTADLLRADIYWHAQHWQDAASAFDKLIGQRWKEQAPLSRVEGQQIIKLAVSEFLSDDTSALVTIRSRYGELMKASEYADMFNVITHQFDPTKTKFRDLAPAIARVNDFEAFMENYRDKLKSGGLSALN